MYTPVFIINLRRDSHRLSFMEQQMKKLDLPYEVVEGVDGKEMTDEQKNVLYDEKGSLQYLTEPLKKSQVGCAASHIKAYNLVRERKLPYALILEDDVLLDEKILRILNSSFLSTSTFDWLQINYTDVGIPFIKNWVTAGLHYAKTRPVTIPYTLIKAPYIFVVAMYEALREYVYSNNPRIVSFARPIYLAGAYIITQQGIEKLLPLTQPILFPADMLPNKGRILCGLDVKAISPLLAQQQTKSFTSNMI